MKKGIVVLTAAFIWLSGIAPGDAVFVPDDGDIFDLDHYYAYSWGIDLGFSTQDTPIVEAYLEFDNIQNWWYENGDVLYIDLIDDAPLGLTPYRDYQASGDYFDGEGLNIIQWTDNSDRRPSDESFALSLVPGAIEALNLYGQDGMLAIGIDPDCHYWNGGVSFSYTTAVVPAPGAVSLSAVGIILIGWLRNRKKV